jgi:malate synthase
MNELLHLIISNKEVEIMEGGKTNWITSKGLSNIGGSFNLGEINLQPNLDLNIYNYSQASFDNALYNNLDLISNNRLYEKLKNYEQIFGYSSEEFYKKWISGEREPRGEFYDWASLYKNLLIRP